MKRNAVSRYSQSALLILLTIVGCTSTLQVAEAITFSFAGYSWDQDSTPDGAALLGNGVTLGGAVFDALLPNTAAGDVGFPDVPAGAHGSSSFITGLTHARLTGIAITSNTSRPLNLPRGNQGASDRHGIELGWSGGRSFINGIGNDLVLYESSSDATSPENPMLRVRPAGTNMFTDWHYFAPDGWQLYHSDNEGAFATGIDLADLGLNLGDAIDLIQIANLSAADRIVGTTTHTSGGQNFGEGRVVFDGSSTMKPDAGPLASFRDTGYGNSTFDPDPLYVGMLGSEVPEPAAALLVAIGGLAISAIRRR